MGRELDIAGRFAVVDSRGNIKNRYMYVNQIDGKTYMREAFIFVEVIKTNKNIYKRRE